MIHDTQSTQISQKQHGHDIYVIMKAMCPSWLLPHWLYGNSYTWAHNVRLLFLYDGKLLKYLPYCTRNRTITKAAVITQFRLQF